MNHAKILEQRALDRAAVIKMLDDLANQPTWKFGIFSIDGYTTRQRTVANRALKAVQSSDYKDWRKGYARARDHVMSTKVPS